MSQQVASTIPVAKTKNPKRVAAGKAIDEETRQAREAQKKALVEAHLIIANQDLQIKADPPAPDPPAADPPVADTPTKNVLTTTQWLSVISIIISVVGIYYKREEIKKVFAKKSPPTVDFMPPPFKTQRKGGLQPTD